MLTYGERDYVACMLTWLCCVFTWLRVCQHKFSYKEVACQHTGIFIDKLTRMLTYLHVGGQKYVSSTIKHHITVM